MSLIYFSVPSNSIHQLLSSIKPNAMTEQNMEKSEYYDTFKLIHISLDIFASFLKQKEEQDLIKYLLSYASKNFNKSKIDCVKFLNLYSHSLDYHSQNNCEMRMIAYLFNCQENSMLYTKLFVKYRKFIVEYLYCSNSCKNLDKIFLSLKQWTVIITRIFSDHNPATIISNIIKTIGGYQKKDLSHTNLNSIALIELCIQQYIKMKKKGNNETDDEKEINSKEIENVSLSSPSKFSPDKKSDNREEEPQRQISELLYESEAQKYQIEDLKSTIVKLQNENQYLSEKKQTLLEFWQVIYDSYLELLSYAYHVEVSCNTMIELTKQENSLLFQKFEIYKKEDNHMELQIFYMTIQESKDILKKEGILIENQSDFDRFLKEIGSKSFQEKHFHFPRYDNIKKLFEILKERKLWTNPPFMKKNEQINNNPIEDFSMTSSPMKITASAMRHDSLESNDRTSESDYSK